MFASVRAAFDIPRDQNLQAARLPDAGARDSICRASGRPRQLPIRRQPGGRTTRAAIRRPSRRPTPSRAACQFRARVRRSASCKPTGVSLGARPARRRHAGSRRRRPKRSPSDCRRCGVEVLLDRRSPRGAGRYTASIWLPALDDEGDLSDLTLAAWREALRYPRQVALPHHARALRPGRACRAPSWSPRRASAGSTATTRREPSRLWAAPSPASPRPTNASGRTRW